MPDAETRVSAAHLRSVASLAGLALSEERLALLAPQVQAVIQGVEALDQLDLSEVEPEVVFRAQWEEDNGR